MVASAFTHGASLHIFICYLNALLTGVTWSLKAALMYIFLTTKDIENFFQIAIGIVFVFLLLRIIYSVHWPIY